MSSGSTDILGELEWRGLVAASTDREELAVALAAGPVTLYCGFDPTAPSLHVGNLVPLLVLKRFQDFGHRPLGLVGGATGLIGDPSGRTTERALNDDQTVSDWVRRIRVQLARFLVFDDSPTGADVISNLDWTRDLPVLTFLRDIGKHFSVNVMLAKDSVRSRLDGPGISYTEFSYMLLQANDYLEIYRRAGCRLQIGGSDQWGNIVAGLDLIRRVEGAHAPAAHALTVPLVTKADGTKFGKTAEGAVWLDAGMTSPYAFFQFWLNADDRDVPAFLRLFSFRSRPEIEDLERSLSERPERRDAQRALARELTALVHGAEHARLAESAGLALFGRGELAELDDRTLTQALREAPCAESDWAQDRTFVHLLVACGLCESKSAARRAISSGGVYLNNRRVASDTDVVAPGDLLPGGWIVLRRGKRSVAGIRFPAAAAGRPSRARHGD